MAKARSAITSARNVVRMAERHHYGDSYTEEARYFLDRAESDYEDAVEFSKTSLSSKTGKMCESARKEAAHAYDAAMVATGKEHPEAEDKE